ncbi:RagB/SusD family nutrient uptake outer membrane protein, partial [termite gut metagenome]
MGKFGPQKLCSEMSYNENSTEVTRLYYIREEPYGFYGKISL